MISDLFGPSNFNHQLFTFNFNLALTDMLQPFYEEM